MRNRVLKMAQDFFKDCEPSWGAGFNTRVLGQGEPFATECWDYAQRIYGWWKADEWFRKGDIYAVHVFPHGCDGFAFQYGGYWVCNTCGRKGFDKDWWQIKCAPDGDAWCCVGPGFENLQESDNYAFGDTRDAAIEAYGKLMTEREKTEDQHENVK